jgi:hypothetical protein
MQIEADFCADLVELCQREMRSLGAKFAPPDPQDQSTAVLQYFNLKHRHIAPHPRHIIKAKGFSCPATHQAGLLTLFGKIKHGENLMVHASAKCMDADYGDSLLTEWGIHHFHLGTRIAVKGKRKGLVVPTDKLLFAAVTQEWFTA